MSTRPADNPRARHLAAGASIVAALLLAATLAPFDFRPQPGPATAGAYLDLFLMGKSNFADALNNTLLFLPLGFLLAATLRARRAGVGATLALVLSAGGGLSLGIELAQLFLPSRVASPLDVVSNACGAGLGAVACALAEVWARSAPRLLAGLAAYLALAAGASAALQPTVSLASWDPGYRLLIGNEANGRRPWRGYVADLRAASLALEPAAARQLLGGGTTPDFEANRVFDYTLTGSDGLRDRTGSAPDLTWRHERPANQPPRGVRIDGQQWLRSAGPMRAATEAIRARSAFTLAVTVAAASPDQAGPARIVSLSYNSSQRNLTLGQSGPDLVVRIRTASNGPNGRYQQLIAPGVLAEDSPRRLVLTYAGARLTLYVEGRPAVALTLDPEISLLRHLLSGDPRMLVERLPRTAVNLAGYGLYAFALFVPLGLALACAAHLLRGAACRALVAASAVALPALLEVALALGGARAPRPTAALAGAALTVAALLWFSARSRSWRGHAAPPLEV